MKNLVGVMLVSILFTNPISAQSISEWESAGLKGRVKSIREERAELVKIGDKIVERLRFLTRVVTYDDTGNKSEEEWYQRNGMVVERTVIDRDDKGTRTSTVYREDRVTRKLVESFDENGKPKEGAIYDASGEMTSRSTYTYSNIGVLIEAARYDRDGSLINKTMFKHDAKGKQIGFDVYNAAGVLTQSHLLNSVEREETVYGVDGKVAYGWSARKPSCESDSYGNCIKQSTPGTVTRGDTKEEIIEVLYRTITYY